MVGNKRSLKNKKTPSATDNWVSKNSSPWKKSQAEKALDKVKKSREGKIFEMVKVPGLKGYVEKEVFYCPSCGGKTIGVSYCDNPECPNMPCCGKPKDQCNCNG